MRYTLKTTYRKPYGGHHREHTSRVERRSLGELIALAADRLTRPDVTHLTLCADDYCQRIDVHENLTDDGRQALIDQLLPAIWRSLQTHAREAYLASRSA